MSSESSVDTKPRTDDIDAAQDGSRDKAKTERIDRLAVRLLTPNEVSFMWNLVKQSILDGSDGYITTDIELARVLSALTEGRLQCWIVACDDTKHFVGAVLTQVVNDGLVGKKGLSILSLSAKRPVRISAWREGLSVLVKFAKSRDCSYVTAMTRNPRVVEMVTAMGFETCSLCRKDL